VQEDDQRAPTLFDPLETHVTRDSTRGLRAGDRRATQVAVGDSDGIRAFHWACLGARTWRTEGQLFAVWPDPVNADECFRAAGFTSFDQGDRWDDDYERFVAAVVASLGRHGEAVIHGGVSASPAMSPLEQLLWAVHDDNAPCRLEFGSPARAFVQAADGHEILWIWLDDRVASTWSTWLRPLVGETRLVETQLEWARLLPRELE
jgi:hypothetical protein